MGACRVEESPAARSELAELRHKLAWPPPLITVSEASHFTGGVPNSRADGVPPWRDDGGSASHHRHGKKKLKGQ